MDDKALQKLLTLAPGEFQRMHSGFFQGLPRGEIAFLPSIFRLPWHSKKPRIVGSEDISKILRAELIEILALIIILIFTIHLFFIEIVDFYLNLFDGNIFFAVIAHAITMLLLVITILLLNNVPFSWIRGRLVSKLPVAEGALSRSALSKWQLERNLWAFSLTTDNKAAKLRPWGIIFYLLLFCISMPIFTFIIAYIAINEKLTADNIYIITLFIVYGVLSIWAFFESVTVLRRRIKASKELVALQKRIETLEQSEN